MGTRCFRKSAGYELGYYGVLAQDTGGGRSTSYSLAQVESIGLKKS